MKHITLKYSSKREIKKRLFAPWIFVNIEIISMCILFSIIGILLRRNELYADQWYFESSADGLFGNDNRSIVTLCSNFLLEGIIYLFSLSGLRLNWCNIIFISMNLISSILVCKVIMIVGNDWYRHLMCLTFLSFITVYVFFFFQFTTIATYVISAGCLWLFYSIEYQKSKSYNLFGIIWIILGASIRIDCIVFPIIFMGLVWLFKQAKLFCQNQSYPYEKKKIMKSKTFLKYFLPFGITLILIVGIREIDEFLMERFNPGFTEWNKTRSLVDDYDKPDYYEYFAEYQDIGLSYNDYRLLVEMDDYDPEIFTDSVYRELLKLKNLCGQKTVKDIQPSVFIINFLKKMTGSIGLIIGTIICICAFIYVNAWSGMCCTVLVLASLALHIYFTFVGRLIDRIEYSIWIAVLTAMIAALLLLRGEQKIHGRSVIKGLILGLLCLTIFFVRPNFTETSKWAAYSGMSIADIYRTQIRKNNSYLKFLCAQTMSNRTVNHETHDKIGSDYIMKRKDLLFLISHNDWLQPYPLFGEDIFKTAPVGAAENWCIFGGYWSHLQPMKKIYEKWQIYNPFRSMTNENVRVVFKDTVMREKSYVINTYLKEHYYEDVNFSVESIEDRTIIGRYMRNFSKEDLFPISGHVRISFCGQSSYPGMAQINLSAIDVDGFSISQDEAYIEIHGDNGTTYTCTMFNAGNGQLEALFYDSIIKESSKYTLDFIYVHNGQSFAINLGVLAI